MEEIAKHAEEATVLIGTLDSSQTAVGQGSGFFVRPNLIVTNFHVVKDKSVIIYQRFGQEEYNSIKRVRGVDRKHDLALLEVSTSSAKPLNLSHSVSVNTGQLVHVMSYPKNLRGDLEGTFSTGRISNARRERFGRTEIQIDARGNPGSSGGPVLNSDGEVIGVVWGGDEDVLQIFAIPVKHLRALLRRHNIRLPPKPNRKTVNRDTVRRNEENAIAEAEKAKAEARKIEAEAKKVEAEARKAEAEAEIVQAEAKKAEAERAKLEAGRVEVERAKADTKKPNAEREKSIAEAERTEVAPKKTEPISELKPTQIAQTARNATVVVIKKDGQGKVLGQATGFFVHPDFIATNHHVIKDGGRFEVKRVVQGTMYAVKSIKASSKVHDLALLHVPTSGIDPLHIADMEKPEIGQRVYIVGNLGGREGSFTDGSISNMQVIKGVNKIELTATAFFGSSGSPVLNSQGDVIGIVTGGSHSQNLNLTSAVASEHLRKLAENSSVLLPPKPKHKSVNRDTVRRNEKKAIAEAEKAKSESKIAEAERTEGESEKKSKTEVVETKERITDRLQAATVLIYGSDRNGNEGPLGSGFFVSQDQVATDFHVIDGSKLQGVKPVGQSTQSTDGLLKAKLLKTKRARHLAILQVEKTDVQPLPLDNSEGVDIGERIYMVGDPTSGEYSEGNISKILNEGGVRYFEFDAPVSPGISGGPIVNAKGEVIGVTALKVVAITGTLKNAIPSDYLTELLDGEGDPPTQPTEPPVSRQEAEDAAEATPSTQSDPKRLLDRAIKLYEKTRYNDAIKSLESVMFRINDPETRAIAHLYLGFSKWGLEDTENSVNADFREALRYNPDVKLPPRIGQNHPVFKPHLELARRESLGTLTVSASPPETEIWLFGGEMKRRLLGTGTASLRLFKGNYAVEGVLEGAHKVVPVLITPDDHEEISLVMDGEAPPSHEFELTLDLFSTEKPKDVKVHYTLYDANGSQLDQGNKEMQMREHKPETSIWVYHVKLPSAPQGGKIVYRIEADGKIIRDDPMQVEILEPPESAFIDINQTVPIKARIISNVKVSEVRVVYDAPTTLANTSPSQKLEKESSSNTYKGNIPTGRNQTDGTTWFYVTATNKKGVKAWSATRAVRAKPPEPVPLKITLEPVPDSLPINKPINITAEVKSGSPLQEVRVYYDFPRKQLSETSPYATLENKSSDTYVGKIPKERTREEGYIWFFVMATTEQGMKSQSEDSVIEVKEPTTRTHQGVWASHSWSNLVSNEGFYSGWERGDVLSFAFLREGRGIQTLGVQLDYTYENPDYISAIAQWGPSTRESPVAFAFLAGAAGHRSSDPNFSRVRQSSQIMPLLGGSMKFYPLDRVALDLMGTMKLRSESGTAGREPSFTEEFLHHYEMGIRLYISPSLNFKVGYGRWRLGEYDNASVQVGLGATF